MNNRRDDTAKARRMTGRDNITILSTSEQHAAYSVGLLNLDTDKSEQANDIVSMTLDLQENVSDVGPVAALEIMGRVALLVLENWTAWGGCPSTL